ncbi:hypothetical protein BDV26DRAFT_258599 [Aspergillus bertholletiae]|uniref:Uncharacterized protein n=1 Tax=Aspergillus bertholletiae TaxID=1226010 RepID=A0A5N7BDF4_9EURO|nr:hypothetical protein BDV26DRAFT_258599 [Aspergillus bertholletiae]
MRDDVSFQEWPSSLSPSLALSVSFSLSTSLPLSFYMELFVSESIPCPMSRHLPSDTAEPERPQHPLVSDVR